MNFITTELDPAVLLTLFHFHTSWHVLTGAACTGKTTLINLLARRGFKILPEVARQFFEEERARGRSVEQIHSNYQGMQRSIAALQLRYELGLDPESIVFLDRAFPDSLAFFRVFGMDPDEILPDCFLHRYAGVFLLERLPFLRNQALGPEDNASSDFLNEWLERDYTSLGYQVVKVPVLPPEERLAFILDRLPSYQENNHR
jgi:predicted ATPase